MELSAEDRPFNFECETRREELMTRLGEREENSIWVEKHHKGNTLTVQSAFFSTIPYKARAMDRMSRRLIGGIVLFVAVLASSIAWALSGLFQLAVVSLIIYAVSWALTTTVILEMRSYISKSKPEKADYFKKYDKVTLPKQATP